jgi:hypothetical protein
VRLGGKVGNTVKNGIIAYTVSATRGGLFHVSDFRLPLANASWTTEPFIRAGYPGATAFSEAGFDEILIENIFVDGNNVANFRLIDLRCHSGDYVKKITIRNVTGVNLPAGTDQLAIWLNAAATNVVLNIENVSLTDSARARPAISRSINAANIIGGQIRNVNAVFTASSRPAKCNPLYVKATIDLTALARWGDERGATADRNGRRCWRPGFGDPAQPQGVRRDRLCERLQSGRLPGHELHGRCAVECRNLRCLCRETRCRVSPEERIAAEAAREEAEQSLAAHFAELDALVAAEPNKPLAQILAEQNQ